jgi:PAS domain-containing protein
VRETCVALFAPHGRPGPLAYPFLTDLTDLTGRPDAERDAGTQRRFLRALLDSLTASVAAVDSEGRVQIANRAMFRLHGLPESAAAQSFDAASMAHLRRPDGTPLRREHMPLLRAARGEHVRDEEMRVEVTGAPRLARG